MQTIADFPYFEVQFNKDGTIHDENEVNAVLGFLQQEKITDLFVMSHGWNNDMAEARDLYKDFFSEVRAGLNSHRHPELELRKFAVLGILWPSKKFADDELTAGAAANFDLMETEEDELRRQLESLKGTFDNPEADERLERAKEWIEHLDSEQNDASGLVDLIRSLPQKNDLHPDDGSEKFFKVPGDELVDKLSRPDIPVSSGDGGGFAADFDSSLSVGDQGGAAAFNFFGGIKSAIRKVLNFTTYYQMKERAGVVGRTGAYQVLTRIRQNAPGMKIHLIGHSFGGRLVTSITMGPESGNPILPESITLLQAAFSHNGFAEKFDGQKDGFFRSVITGKKIAGPILVTHSIKDFAVGTAYPIASKLSGNDAADFGGPKSPFGGIGRNGCQFTPEANDKTALGPVTTSYSFEAGKVYNLKADTIIMGHSDIAKPEVANALLNAVSIT